MTEILVAGIGNIFLGDDGFGGAVVDVLRARTMPAGVTVADYGISGMHLAYDLLAGYDTTILVDATQRGDVPGTLYVIELDTSGARAGGSPVDAHGMQPDTVPDLVRTLGGTPGRMLLVGCEPENTDEGMGLSPAVRSAVEPAADLVADVVNEHLKTEV